VGGWRGWRGRSERKRKRKRERERVSDQIRSFLIATATMRVCVCRVLGACRVGRGVQSAEGRERVQSTACRENRRGSNRREGCVCVRVLLTSVMASSAEA
jgi:hypothetical protein